MLWIIPTKCGLLSDMHLFNCDLAMGCERCSCFYRWYTHQPGKIYEEEEDTCLKLWPGDIASSKGLVCKKWASRTDRLSSILRAKAASGCFSYKTQDQVWFCTAVSVLAVVQGSTETGSGIKETWCSS